MIRSLAFACALAVFAAPLSSFAAKPTPKPMKPMTPPAGTHQYGCKIVHGKKVCAVGGVAPSHGVVSPMNTNKH